jgi:hypothetical protein
MGRSSWRPARKCACDLRHDGGAAVRDATLNRKDDDHYQRSHGRALAWSAGRTRLYAAVTPYDGSAPVLHTLGPSDSAHRLRRLDVGWVHVPAQPDVAQQVPITPGMQCRVGSDLEHQHG